MTRLFTKERVGEETAGKAGRHGGQPGGEGVVPGPGHPHLLPDSQGGQGVVTEVKPGGELGWQALQLPGAHSHHSQYVALSVCLAQCGYSVTRSVLSGISYLYDYTKCKSK